MPALLDSQVPHLPLEQHSGKQSAPFRSKAKPKPEAGAAAAAAAVGRAQGSMPEAWNFRRTLVTCSSLSIQDLAPHMYRLVPFFSDLGIFNLLVIDLSESDHLPNLKALLACRAILRALPASSRSWFQGLGDKKLASAIEVRSFRPERGV